MKDDQMPCGHCDMGIYADCCVRTGVEFCIGKQTLRDALREAPRCKSNEKRICMGARDFIAGLLFPFTEENGKKILEQLD